MFIKTLWWLMGTHVLADYVLQPEWMGRHKDPSALEHATWDVKYGPWWWSMLAHSFLNGCGVAWVTGNLWFGVGETMVHFVADTSKCLGIITTGEDQTIHLVSKLFWAIPYVCIAQ